MYDTIIQWAKPRMQVTMADVAVMENVQNSKDESRFCRMYENSKPIMGMVVVQAVFAGANIVCKMALNHGMSTTVLVVYRHAVATLAIAPFAFFLERNSRPNLSKRVLMETFFSAMLGCTLTQNLYYAGVQQSSPTFVCAVMLMVPAVTYIIAVVFRMEKFDTKSVAGKAKAVGTVVTIGGGFLITFYKGISLNLWKSALKAQATKSSSSQNFVKGAVFAIAACVCFALWFIVQTKIGSSYSAHYTSTTLMCLFATVQCVVGALIINSSDFSVWELGGDIGLIASIYTGVLGTGLAYTMMTWCIRKKGPLISSMSQPLQLIMVAIMSTFFLHEVFHLGSLLGSLVIITGLYIVMWAKSKEETNSSSKGSLPSQPLQPKCSENTEQEENMNEANV